MMNEPVKESEEEKKKKETAFNKMALIAMAIKKMREEDAKNEKSDDDTQ